MTLATKNGAIILKDGKLAENCGCCGGWYCCTAAAACPELLKVTATVTASDASITRTRENGRCYDMFGRKIDETPISWTAMSILNASVLSGVHELPLYGTSNGVATYRKDFSADSVGCPGAHAVVTTFPSGAYQFVLAANAYKWQERAVAASPPAQKTLAQMKCTSEDSGTSYGCDAHHSFSGPQNVLVLFQGVLLTACLPEVTLQQFNGQIIPLDANFSVPGSDGSSSEVRDGTLARTQSGTFDVSAQLTFTKQ